MAFVFGFLEFGFYTLGSLGWNFLDQQCSFVTISCGWEFMCSTVNFRWEFGVLNVAGKLASY